MQVTFLFKIYVLLRYKNVHLGHISCYSEAVLILYIGNCVEVKSVDHKNIKKVGQYFTFWQADVNAILGSYDHGSTYMIDQYRNNYKILEGSEVKIWTKDNTGSIGDGHGRYNPGTTSSPGQWKTGDYFCFPTGILLCSS